MVESVDVVSGRRSRRSKRVSASASSDEYKRQVIAFPRAVAGEVLDVGVVAINKIAGCQVLAGICIHVSVLLIHSVGTRDRAETTAEKGHSREVTVGGRREAGEDIY